MFDFKSQNDMELVAKTHEWQKGKHWDKPAPIRGEATYSTYSRWDGLLWVAPILVLFGFFVARFYGVL